MRLILAGMIGAILTMTAFGQSDDTFCKIYDAYIAGVKAKDFQAIVKLRTADQQKELTEGVPPGRDEAYHKALFEQLAQVTPLSYELRFVTLSKDGNHARMVVVGMVPVPPEAQKEAGLPPEQKMRVTVAFAKEAGAWKMGELSFGSEAEDSAKPKDLKMGTRGDYSEAANTDMGGEIQRLEKQASGTVYVIRVGEEEDAVFVPAAHVSADFVAGAIVSFHAAKHGKDPLKYWAESAQLVQ
jgi:ketosteroid isomerase-like protein